MTRLVLILMAGVTLPWTFLSVLAREWRYGAILAAQAVRHDAHDLGSAWRANSLNPANWTDTNTGA